MLVITRKVGESVNLYTKDGQKVKVVVLRPRGRRTVRLGIDAPMDIMIVREEIDCEGDICEDKERC